MKKFVWSNELKEELLSTANEKELKTFCKKHKVKYSTAERHKRRVKAKSGVEKNLYYERQITKLQERNTGLQEQVDFQNVMKDVAKKHIQALPQVDKPQISKGSRKLVYEIANLLLSDLQIGEVISEKDMGGINSYDFNIFSRRMEFMAHAMLSIKGKMQGYYLPHLEVHGLGDFITGLIHDELVQNSEDSIIEWLFNGALVIAQFLSELLTSFNTIHFTGVVGNHGRMTQKVTYKKRYVNWDYIFYQVLAIMMVNNPRITFDLPKSFWTIREVGGRKLLLLHGDNIKSWSGIPWYGIQRAIYKLTELLTANEKYFDDVCIAHFHSLGTLTRTKGRIMLNGSVSGGDEFSLGSLFAASDPMQLFFGINPKHRRKTWEFPLDLSDISKTTGRYKYSKAIPIVNQMKGLLK